MGLYSSRIASYWSGNSSGMRSSGGIPANRRKHKNTRPIDYLVSLLERPFGGFDGTSLVNLSRKCCNRCLVFQAMMAKHYALEQGWIKVNDAESPSSLWSELEQMKNEKISCLVVRLRGAAQKRVYVVDGSGADDE
ncbi:hypothetical protein BDR26DRAFT_857260 [Obelidium mucronatum]|nr:hypothetical protein BDR26DRAFT_857260 [Obelidium mucronatum]